MSVPYDNGAALSALLYDLADVEYSGTGTTLQEILDANPNLPHHAELQAMVTENGLGNVELVDASWQHVDANGENIYGTMNAATFRFPDGDTYVAYRGTGADNWAYNADSAFGEEPSDMQKWAQQYFDDSMDQHYVPGNELYTTGHSQGGNNAMYTLLTSKYADKITGCVSIDGPGFSQDTIDQIVAERGQAFYERQREKCYAAYGENDYVHCLGEVHITPKGHVIVVGTPDAHDFASYHDIFSHYAGGKLNYQTDKDGNIILQEEKQIPTFVYTVNNYLVKYLPEKERHECARAMMAIVEVAIGNGELSNLSDLGDLGKLLAVGVPLLIFTAATNPGEFMDLMEEMAPELAEWMKRNPIKAVAIIAVITIIAVDIGIILCVVDFFQGVLEFLGEIPGHIKDFVTATFEAVRQFVQDVKEYLRSHSPGGKYVSSNPYFKADTARLRSYAGRLAKVNSRLVSLDGDMNDLYWQVGLMDIFTILEENILTGWSVRLTAAKKYLTTAADSLEAVDKQVQGYMGG